MTTTKNLELYFEHAPVADLTALAAVSTVGIVNGVIIEVAAAGLFEFQTPAVATPDGRDVIAGLGGGVWIRQTLPALKTTAGGAIDFASGGTSAATQQLAMNALAGAVTDKYYLRGNTTNVVMSAIQAADVPTLNQNTSGTAANVTGTVAIGNGGTGQTTQQLALNALAGAVTTKYYLRGDDTNVSMSAIQAGDVPTLNQNTSGTAANVTGTVAVGNGGTGQTTQQLALNALAGAVTTKYYLRGDDTNVSMSAIQAGDVPTLNQDTSGTAAKATNIAAGTANQIPYQTNANTTSYISAAANSVLVTNGSNVPSLSNTLPAVAAGTCTCTDPTTLSSASINTALSNVYSAIVPPAEAAGGATAFSLSVAVSTPQIITGAQVVLPPGKYLLSYSSSQTFTPTATNPATAFSATSYIYNTTGSVPVSNTTFTALSGYSILGDEIFGGTASATVVATFTVTTTLDVYTKLNSAAVAGATFVADYTAITAIRLANTQTTYSANGVLAADSTSTSPQIVTGAQLVLPAGNYLLAYSASQNLTTLVADATTAFAAKSYIYNTTGAAVVTNTTYTSFSGYALTGSEIFGGTSSAAVAVTLGVTTTLDVYVQLSSASAGADAYGVVAEITAVKLD